MLFQLFGLLLVLSVGASKTDFAITFNNDRSRYGSKCDSQEDLPLLKVEIAGTANFFNNVPDIPKLALDNSEWALIQNVIAPLGGFEVIPVLGRDNGFDSLFPREGVPGVRWQLGPHFLHNVVDISLNWGILPSRKFHVLFTDITFIPTAEGNVERFAVANGKTLPTDLAGSRIGITSDDTESVSAFSIELLNAEYGTGWELVSFLENVDGDATQTKSCWEALIADEPTVDACLIETQESSVSEWRQQLINTFPNCQQGPRPNSCLPPTLVNSVEWSNLPPILGFPSANIAVDKKVINLFNKGLRAALSNGDYARHCRTWFFDPNVRAHYVSTNRILEDAEWEKNSALCIQTCKALGCME